jgi:glutathione S-transferase
VSTSANALVIGIPYSPWTLQARWAFQHHRAPYRFEPYVPMVGEPALRARLSRRETRFVREKLSVPILLDGTRTVHGSREIAEYVDRSSTGHPSLFPREQLDAMDRWLTRLEQAKRAGRVLATERLMESDSALVESMPSAWPGLVKRASIPVARRACRFILDKYGGRSFEGRDGAPGEHDQSSLRGLLREVLLNAQDTLERHPFLLGDTLTFADFALVTTLQFVSPSPELVRLGASFQAAWSDAALASELTQLFDARERILKASPPHGGVAL